jgi:hypothetical protein
MISGPWALCFWLAWQRKNALLAGNRTGTDSQRAPDLLYQSRDRLVHHSIFIELNIPSYRLEHAKTNMQSLGADGKDVPTAAPDSGELASGSGLRPSPTAGSPESQTSVAKPYWW